MDRSKLAWAMVAAGVIIAIGAPMDWATVRAGLFELSKKGTEGDGTLTLGAGIIIGVLGLLQTSKRSKGAKIGVLLLGIAVAGIGAYDYTDIMNAANDSEVDVSVGSGLVLTVAGGVFAVVMALMMFGREGDEQQASPVAGAGSPFPPPPPQ